MFVAAAIVVVGCLVVRRIWQFVHADCDMTLLSAFQQGIPDKYFEDKVVWVTGASSGIGEAIALDLCSRGARVVMSARRTDRLEQVKLNCKGKNAASVMILPLDIKDYASHKAAVEAVVEKFGRIDILVNNAGRSQRALVENTDLAVDQEMMALNVIGTISVTKAVLPQFLKQQEGHVVVISSVAGKMASPVSASYSASKHALQGYFDTMRMELAERNILVTSICPGPVQSEGAMNAFTNVTGEKVGEHRIDDSKKITATHCAELVAAAIAYHLDEAWISRHPILLFAYLAQYAPTITRKLAGRVAGARVSAFRSGNRDINAGLSVRALFSSKK